MKVKEKSPLRRISRYSIIMVFKKNLEAFVRRQSTNGVEYNMHRPDRVGLCDSAYFIILFSLFSSSLEML